VSLEEHFIAGNDIDPDMQIRVRLTIAIQSLEFTDKHVVIFVKTTDDINTYISLCFELALDMGYDITRFDNNRIRLEGFQFSLIFEAVGDKYSTIFSDFEMITLF